MALDPGPALSLPLSSVSSAGWRILSGLWTELLRKDDSSVLSSQLRGISSCWEGQDASVSNLHLWVLRSKIPSWAVGRLLPPLNLTHREKSFPRQAENLEFSHPHFILFASFLESLNENKMRRPSCLHPGPVEVREFLRVKESVGLDNFSSCQNICFPLFSSFNRHKVMKALIIKMFY